VTAAAADTSCSQTVTEQPARARRRANANLAK
jgi:hypothetical protein